MPNFKRIVVQQDVTVTANGFHVVTVPDGFRVIDGSVLIGTPGQVEVFNSGPGASGAFEEPLNTWEFEFILLANNPVQVTVTVLAEHDPQGALFVQQSPATVPPTP